MSEVVRHYDTLLAEHYTWMAGGLEARLQQNTAFFARHGVVPKSCGVAIDLGAGPGFQAIPLARAGFTVHALDLNERLLGETVAAAAGLKVNAVLADMRDFARHVAEPAEVIVCMGDTITHLETREQVAALIGDAWKALVPGGRFIVTYRDLSQERTGLERFFIVQSDARRVFTCFLEYAPGHVRVHDLVHVQEPNGAWQFRKSAYAKLRLAQADLTAWLEAVGFRVAAHPEAGGLAALIATKP